MHLCVKRNPAGSQFVPVSSTSTIVNCEGRNARDPQLEEGKTVATACRIQRALHRAAATHGLITSERFLMSVFEERERGKEGAAGSLRNNMSSATKQKLLNSIPLMLIPSKN